MQLIFQERGSALDSQYRFFILSFISTCMLQENLFYLSPDLKICVVHPWQHRLFNGQLRLVLLQFLLNFTTAVPNTVSSLSFNRIYILEKVSKISILLL